MNCASECQVQRADLSQSYLIWKNIVGCVIAERNAPKRSKSHESFRIAMYSNFLVMFDRFCPSFPLLFRRNPLKTRSFPCSFTKSPVPPFSRLARGDLLGFASANLYFSNILLDCHDFVRSRHRSCLQIGSIYPATRSLYERIFIL